jgi:hypothetical protein
MAREGELGIKKSIIKLAENDTVIMQEIYDLKQLFNKMIDQMMIMQQVSKAITDQVKRHESKFYPDSEAGPQNDDWSKQ